MISSSDYTAAQTQIIVLAKVVRQIPLDEFLAAGAKAEALGPMLEPTLYKERIEGLVLIQRLAKALVPFKEEADRLANGE